MMMGYYFLVVALTIFEGTNNVRAFQTPFAPAITSVGISSDDGSLKMKSYSLKSQRSSKTVDTLSFFSSNCGSGNNNACATTCGTTLFMTATSPRQQDQQTTDIPKNGDSSSQPPQEEVNSSSQGQQQQQQQDAQAQAPLSDLDAQVLRSLLEDQPDLAMEENIQRLLRKNELWQQQQDEQKQRQQQQEEDSSSTKSKYSSKTMQDIEQSGGGDAFWNSLKAKAGDLLEQVGLAIVNKIERDLAVSLSLGAFFLERAARDTSRALKAATTSSAQKKVVYTLSSNSSYVMEQQQTFQLPSQSSGEYDLLQAGQQPPTGYAVRADVDLRAELNTPADEFKSVTKGIVEILKSGGTSSTTPLSGAKSRDGKSSATTSSTTTNSNVVRGDDDHNKRLGFVVGRTTGGGSRTERGQRAYRARKETVLKREKEFVATKVARAATGVMVDGTWQLKEEIRKEPAGYKTKVLRQQVSRNVQTVLEGASSVARAALKTSRAQKDRLLSLSTAEEEDVVLEEAQTNGQMQEEERGESDASTTNNVPPNNTVGRKQRKVLSASMKRYQEHLSKMLMESKRNLLLNLQVCLEDPRDTWLVESVLMDRDTILKTNSEALANVVQQMVKFRDELLEDTDPTKQAQNDEDEVVSYLREEMEVLAYRIENLHISATKAVGSGAAQLLLKELVWDIPFVDGDTASILLPELPSEEEEEETTTATAGTNTRQTNNDNVPFYARTSSQQVWEEDDGEEDLFLWPNDDEDDTMEAPIKTVLVRRRDVMSSDQLKTDEYESMKPAFTSTTSEQNSVFASTTKGSFRNRNVMDVNVDDDNDDGVTTVEFEVNRGQASGQPDVDTAAFADSRDFDIEVISGDDDVNFDFNPSRVKQASGGGSSGSSQFNDAGEAGTDLASENDKPPNLLQELALRSLDVAFYVVEKTFVEVVPTAVDSGQLAYKRYDQAQQQGMGREGWQPLDNVQDAARRY